MDRESNTTSEFPIQTKVGVDKTVAVATLLLSLVMGVVGGGWRLGNLETRLQATEREVVKIADVDKKVDVMMARQELIREYLEKMFSSRQADRRGK